MGIIYTGPYEDYLHPPGVRHEGNLDEVLPDGTLHTGPGRPAAAPIGMCASCECGWLSATIATVAEYGDDADQAAENDFRDEHLNPLLARAEVEFWSHWQQRMASMVDITARCMTEGRTRTAIATLVEIKRRIDDCLTVANHIADGRATAGEHPRSASPAGVAFPAPEHRPPTVRAARTPPTPPASQPGSRTAAR